VALTFLTDYPKNLTNKAWQKEKSIADKLKSKTKTGTGKAPEEAEEAEDENGTPRDEDPRPVAVARLSPWPLVADAVMKVDMTPLLRAASARGCPGLSAPCCQG